MKKWFQVGIFLLFLSVSGEAMAYVTPEIAKNDYSMQFLNYIFGDVGGLFSSWNVNVNKSMTLIGVMFEEFNYGVSVLAIFIFAYIYGKGILDTAGEGQFLGKKANSLWVPIRGILGMLLLVPTTAGGGYNMAQVFVM